MVKDCLGNFEGVRGIKVLEAGVVGRGLCGSLLLLLLLLELGKVISLNLFEVIVSAEDNLFSSEAHPHWVGSVENILDPLWTITLHA